MLFASGIASGDALFSVSVAAGSGRGGGALDSTSSALSALLLELPGSIRSSSMAKEEVASTHTLR